MASGTNQIAVVPGDGIGPEVIEQGMRALDLLNKKHQLGLHFAEKDWGADKWLKEGIGLPKNALPELREHYAAVYFGALGDPRIPDMAHGRDILLGMRFGLDLYVNLRPVKLLDPNFSVLAKKTNIDIVIFRENTEDSYVAMGGNFKKGTEQEIAIDESLHTYLGVSRIIRAAFEYASINNRKKVTLADKANAIVHAGSLWRRVFADIQQEYPAISAECRYVDVMAMEMVQKPEEYDVIVTTNLFGDILSDLGAGLIGGLGLMASANLHPGKCGLFEPVHGSAPDIANTGKANPFAAVLSAALMLDSLGYKKSSKDLHCAVAALIQEGSMTKDLGGNLSTHEVGDALLKMLQKNAT